MIGADREAHGTGRRAGRELVLGRQPAVGGRGRPGWRRGHGASSPGRWRACRPPAGRSAGLPQAGPAAKRESVGGLRNSPLIQDMGKTSRSRRSVPGTVSRTFSFVNKIYRRNISSGASTWRVSSPRLGPGLARAWCENGSPCGWTCPSATRGRCRRPPASKPKLTRFLDDSHPQAGEMRSAHCGRRTPPIASIPGACHAAGRRLVMPDVDRLGMVCQFNSNDLHLETGTEDN